ncbi:11251_t:CDS:10 [Paraglomus occultum]|uniref:Long-chain-fatty-acid--CoA ligase n=1 Tax=Paraglomus occultum TaxID=144539 RepID=A0A9N8VZB6_9GLOM|nr:11251_t:CDS:10 [Paraglomus occultum]
MSAPVPIKYSIELPNTRKPGQTGIYRNVDSPDTIVKTFRPGVTTLYDIFLHGLSISRDKPCIGHRQFNKITGKYGEYVWQTYDEVANRANNLAAGLVYLNENEVKNSKVGQWTVGIYSNNRPEWFITDKACAMQNLITVPLYDTLGPETVGYIFNHADIAIVVAAENRIQNILRVSHKSPGLKVIISMDPLSEPSVTNSDVSAGKVLKEWAAEKGILLVDFAEVEGLGKKHPREHLKPSPNDLACICYTSGTTGVPKGALLSHENMTAACAGALGTWPARQDDILISYLPFAHVFGRVAEICVTTAGASIGYFHGDILALVDDIACLRPTLFPSVPRLLTRIYGKLQQATVEAPGLKGALARKAIEVKFQRLAEGQGYTHAFWDTLIFRKVRQLLGGRVRCIITGSAPIASDVLQFLRIAFVCDIAEGYGQTEGVAAATLTRQGENKAGHVGGPCVCVELKLVDVPEMNYLSIDKPFPRGELCLRGPNVCLGYHKDPENTKATIDSEGWLYTGDIAYVDERGAFTIIDRKKNIFKLSQGEYIAPEKLENVYVNSPLVLQIFVHGDSLRNYLVAIVVPDPEMFIPWVNKITNRDVQLGDEQELQKLMDDPIVKREFLKELDQVGKAAQLRGFEFVKVIHLTHVPFSVENELLTPTLKLKRHQASQFYRKEIDRLYNEFDESQRLKAKL